MNKKDYKKLSGADPWRTPALNENISKRCFEFSTVASGMERERVCKETFWMNITIIQICNGSFYVRILKVFGASLYTRILATIQYKTQKTMVAAPKYKVGNSNCIKKYSTLFLPWISWNRSLGQTLKIQMVLLFVRAVCFTSKKETILLLAKMKMI